MCANVKIPLTPLLTTASGGGGQNPRISSTAIDKKKLELHQLLQNAVDDNKYSLCEDLLKKGAPVNAPDTFEDRPDRHPVIIAAKQGFLDILQLLLNNGGDTEVSDKNGQTALHHAALNDKAACCQELLGKGALVAATNNDGDTPLHVAVKHDSIEVCQKLLESNNIVDKINKKGYTPLHIAIKECNKIILSLLLDHNANRVIPDKRGYLPFHYAAKEGCLDCCRKLISHEDTVQRQINSMTKDGLTPLMLAAEGGFYHCCDLILRANIIHTDSNGNTTLQYKDKRGETALHHVMAGTFIETVSFLLDKGACPNTVNKNGDTPLLKAVGKATTICTELCVRNNGNLRIKNNGGQSVLHLAAKKNSLKNLEYLLPLDGIKEMIDDQDIKGFTAFHYTLKKKSIKCSLILFNNGASVNISTYSLMSPLHMLANAGFAELCELVLVQKDVQVNVKNKHKQTPLHLAAAQGSLECCSQLLLKGAKTSVKDSEGCTPCHSAASNNHIKCLELLVGKGYDIISAKDNGGYTALHYAAKFGSLSCCTYLVKRAKFLIWDETNKGDLPIELAFKNKKYEVLAFLIQNQYKKSGQSNFKIHVHKYMHSALQDMDHPKTRMVAIKAIIESVWWKSAFESHFETKQNSTDEYIFKVSKNFTYLIEHHPDLAMMVMDKCYNYNEKTWDFTIVENHFYIPGKVHESPFEKTGKLKNDATTSYENEHEWLEQNALTKMQLHNREELLVHRFTKAWLLHRWTSCAKNMFFIHLALEILFTILLFILLCMTRSWAHQTLKRDIMCNLPRCFVVSDSNCSKNINESLLMNCHNDLQQYVTSANESDMSPDMMKNSSLDVKPIILTLCSSVVPHISTANVTLTIALASLSSLLFVIEVYALIKLQQLYFCMECSARWAKLVLTFLFFLPFTQCFIDTGVREDWQLSFGIAAVLVQCLYLITTLNRLPILFAFMPVTTDFITGFLKFIGYIIMIVLLFASIFHFLFWNHKVFSNITRSLVKTVALMLGDYGYDDLFHGDDDVKFPVTSKVFFLIFIITVGIFLTNLIISKPDNLLENFRSKADLHRVTSVLQWIQFTDICFPSWRRQNIVGTHIFNFNYWYNCLDHKMLNLNFEEVEEKDPMNKEFREGMEMLMTVMNATKSHSDQIELLKLELKSLQKIHHNFSVISDQIYKMRHEVKSLQNNLHDFVEFSRYDVSENENIDTQDTSISTPVEIRELSEQSLPGTPSV